MSHSLNFQAEDQRGSAQNGNTQVIIQCPSCQTKFSLEPQALETTSSPKFHCSRCDAVFTQGDKPRTGTVSDSAPTYSSPAHRRPNLQSLKNSRQLEIPKRIDSTFRAQAPLEGEHDSGQLNLFSGLNLGNGPSASFVQLPDGPSRTIPSLLPPSDTSTEIDRSLNFSSTQTTPLKSPSASDDHIHIDNFGPVRSAPLSDDPLPSIPREKMKIAAPAQTTPNPVGELVTLGWRAMALPIGGIFATLVIISLCTFFNISFGESVKNYLLPTAPSKAPNELFIRSTKVRRITLDNGESVQVIFGAVVNRSESPVRDVKIEATLFDGSGKAVSETRVDSAATLAKARIKSMTPEMILESQNAKSGKRSIIQPGESREFAIALTGKPSRAARHFAVRVYSARSAA